MAKRKAKKINNNFARTLAILGILLILLGLVTQSQIFYRFLVTQRERPVVSVSYRVPLSIAIPSQKLNIKVTEGGIVDGQWILSDTSALYLPTSGHLGEGYNTIIYAHNTLPLFGNLYNLAKGDQIILKDKAGNTYSYQVENAQEVDPTDLKKLYSSEKNTLTLFTCSGWADTSRILVRAKLLDNLNIRPPL